MKTKLFLLAMAAACLQSFSQPWQATNLTNVNYLAITGIGSHKSNLYATVFNGFTASLYRLDAGNSSWSSITTPTSITVPRFVKSAGSKMYISTVNSGVFSMLYYTTDGANTFVLDTVGLPKSFTGVALIYGVQYYKGKVIVGMGGNGYYLKDTAATTWTSVNPTTSLVAVNDPLTFAKDTLVAYDNSGASVLYVSGNYGSSWTVRSSNLPADYKSNLLVADDVSGRLYSAGSWSNNTQYALWYSDDLGRTWTTAANAAPFISLNANNTQQKITSILAHDPVFYMALENNKNNTAPNLVGSLTGFPNLAYDTLGLPLNAAGGVFGLNLLMHQNQPVLGLNVIDVYIKGGAATAIGEKTMQDADVTVFPNPAATILKIKSGNHTPVTGIKMLDGAGKVVYEYNGETTEINVTGLARGIYLLEVYSEKRLAGTKRIIKE